MKEIHYLLALQSIKGVGNILAIRLLRHFESAEAVFHSPVNKLLSVTGINVSLAKNIVAYKNFENELEEAAFIEKENISAYSIVDEAYPYYLKHCYDAPYLIFYKGSCNWNKRNIISIVGTRKMSEYGKQTVERLIQEISNYNPIIVSGLAFGVDSASHKFALEAKLETIGVVAHGLDIIYPHENKGLADKMIKNGGVLTEYWSKTNPDRENFPSRNRIIAGIAEATIVVEAAKQGGALITANIANSYSREVFAVPGRINDTYSEGCNTLIRNNTAQLITSGEDIALFLGWSQENEQAKIQQLFEDISEEETVILYIIQNQPHIEIDNLIIESKMSQSKVAMILLELEMKNKITPLPGKKFMIK